MSLSCNFPSSDESLDVDLSRLSSFDNLEYLFWYFVSSSRQNSCKRNGGFDYVRITKLFCDLDFVLTS